MSDGTEWTTVVHDGGIRFTEKNGDWTYYIHDNEDITARNPEMGRLSESTGTPIQDLSNSIKRLRAWGHESRNKNT